MGCIQERTTITLIYEKYNLPFFFFYYSKSTKWYNTRESRRGKIQLFRELLLLRSVFRREVQNHFKILSHLSFTLLLYFHESSLEPSQGTESSSLLIACEGWTLRGAQLKWALKFSPHLHIIPSHVQLTFFSCFILYQLLWPLNFEPPSANQSSWANLFLTHFYCKPERLQPS